MKISKATLCCWVASDLFWLYSWWTVIDWTRYVSFGMFVVFFALLIVVLTYRPKPAIEQHDTAFVFGEGVEPAYCLHHQSFFCADEPLLEVGQRSFDCQCAVKRTPPQTNRFVCRTGLYTGLGTSPLERYAAHVRLQEERGLIAHQAAVLAVISRETKL